MACVARRLARERARHARALDQQPFVHPPSSRAIAMSTPRTAHRRSFLKAVGVGLASLPFYRPLEHAFAQSMGESLPLKLIGVCQPHGICAEYFAMRPGDTTTSFDLRYENCTLRA